MTPANRFHVEALAASLRSVGRKVYNFGLHYAWCPYTRGTYQEWDAVAQRYVAASCSETCRKANAALADAERWLAEQQLRQDALPLEVE